MKKGDQAADTSGHTLLTACLPGLTHGAFRLYVILDEVSARTESEWFQVTLHGLQTVHPGSTGKVAGVSTIARQLGELRAQSLLDARHLFDKSRPDVPVLVRVLRPCPGTWRATDGTIVRLDEIERIVGA